MSWAWTLPVPPPPRCSTKRPLFDLERTRVVIPTFRDWDSARETIEGLLRCMPRPSEIVLVDDNADGAAPAWVRQLPIHLVSYPGNRGPAFARNAGARLHAGGTTEWLYFTDTGCGRAADFFNWLEEAMHAAVSGCVACAAPVQGVVDGSWCPINRYMTVEGILNPPMDRHGPQAVVTANALVNVAAFDAVGGFDCSYPFAAAEDIDLGVKLRALGGIAWADGAVVTHRFEECDADFRRRFVRYGRGTAHLERQLTLPRLRPTPIVAELPELQYLADLQEAAMLEGYESYKRDAVKADFSVIGPLSRCG